MGYEKKRGASALRSAATSPPTLKAHATATPQDRIRQKQVMLRLRRVEGQIRGVLTMMEQDKPCDAIAQQLSAARKALDKAFYEMMACAMEMEVNQAPNSTVLSEHIAEKIRLLAKYA